MESSWVQTKGKLLVPVTYKTSKGDIIRELPSNQHIQQPRYLRTHANFLGEIVADVEIGEQFQTQILSKDVSIGCYNDANIQKLTLEFREDGTLRMYGIEGILFDRQRFEKEVFPLKSVKEHFYFQDNQPDKFTGRFTTQDIWPREMPVSINNKISDYIFALTDGPGIDQEDVLQCLSFLGSEGENYNEKRAINRFFIL